jgi:hypothetical protein
LICPLPERLTLLHRSAACAPSLSLAVGAGCGHLRTVACQPAKAALHAMIYLHDAQQIDFILL